MKRWGITSAVVILILLLAGSMSIPLATALDPELIPPVAGFTTPLENVMLYENVTFDGSSSYDPNGMNLTYSWDFDSSDGIQEDGTGMMTDHRFKMVGTYVVTLTLSNGNTKAIAKRDIVVYAGSEKVYPPVAVISTRPAMNGTSLVIEPNTLVEFNGKGSYDPNADPVEHEWRFSDDGGNSSSDTIGHLFEAPGMYEVTLTVTTKDGKTDSTTLTVQVMGEPPDPGGDETESEGGMGWAIFIIMIFILLLLGLGGFIAFMAIAQKRNALMMGEDEDGGGRPGRFRTMQQKKTGRQKKRARDGGVTGLRRKERRLDKQIEKEEEKLEKEIKSSAFSGLMDMFTAKPKDDEEEDPHGAKRRAKARPRREKEEEKKGGGAAVRPTKEVPVRRPPKDTPPKRGQKPGGVSLRPKRGVTKDDQIKKELEHETSKLESFLSDILSSPKKDGDDTKDAKTLPRRQPRSLPPAREQKMRAPPKVPSRPTRAKSDKDMSDADIKAELKAMEEQMDKDISKLFGK